MAQWYLTEIEFTGRRPTPAELVRLNHAANILDSDFPDIGIGGMDDANWRSPSIQLETALGFLHHHGFPCRGRQVYESDWGIMPNIAWTDSSPEKYLEYLDSMSPDFCEWIQAVMEGGVSQ